MDIEQMLNKTMLTCTCMHYEERMGLSLAVRLIQLKASEKVATTLSEKRSELTNPVRVSQLLGLQLHGSSRWPGLVPHSVLVYGSALTTLSTLVCHTGA